MSYNVFRFRYHDIMYGILHLLGAANAVSNPILYGYLNENFKSEYRNLYRKMPWYSGSINLARSIRRSFKKQNSNLNNNTDNAPDNSKTLPPRRLRRLTHQNKSAVIGFSRSDSSSADFKQIGSTNQSQAGEHSLSVNKERRNCRLWMKRENISYEMDAEKPFNKTSRKGHSLIVRHTRSPTLMSTCLQPRRPSFDQRCEVNVEFQGIIVMKRVAFESKYNDDKNVLEIETTV